VARSRPRFRHVQAKQERRAKLLSDLKESRTAVSLAKREVAEIRWLARVTADHDAGEGSDEAASRVVTRLRAVAKGDNLCKLAGEIPDQVDRVIDEGLRARVRRRKGSPVRIGDEMLAVSEALAQAWRRAEELTGDSEGGDGRIHS